MDKNIIVYAGHFYNWKGVDTIIQAAREFDQHTLVYLVGGAGKEIEK